jgi:hypothetical protein
MQTPHLYKLIGEVRNTFCATNDEYGLTVSLDGDSKWIVDESSYLTSLSLASGAAITAPAGYKVSMTVDGVEKEITAGSYKGKIVLTVKKA